MGATSLVTALRNADKSIYAVVDEDGKTIPVGSLVPVAVTAAKTLTAADNGTVLYNNTGTARTITVPKDLPLGFRVTLIQKAAGALSVVAGAGATVTSKDGFTKTNGANSTITVTNSGLPNDYLLNGQGVA